MPALTSHSESVSIAGSRTASTALSMLLPSDPGWLVETAAAENAGLASAMARAAFDFGDGLHPVVDVELAENLVQVVLDGIGADAQDAAYLGIGLAHPHPVHDFGLAPAQPEVFAIRQVWGKRRPPVARQGCNPAQRGVKIGQQHLHGAERGTIKPLPGAEKYVQAVVMPALVADAVQQQRPHALQGPAKRTPRRAVPAQHVRFVHARFAHARGNRHPAQSGPAIIECPQQQRKIRRLRLRGPDPGQGRYDVVTGSVRAKITPRSQHDLMRKIMLDLTLKPSQQG